MVKQGEILTEEVRNGIITKFKEGKLVSEIIKETDLRRTEVKNIIEDYLNTKLVSDDKRI